MIYRLVDATAVGCDARARAAARYCRISNVCATTPFISAGFHLSSRAHSSLYASARRSRHFAPVIDDGDDEIKSSLMLIRARGYTGWRLAAADDYRYYSVILLFPPAAE